ncbi:alpha/beta hydrolase [Agromyces sp. NPDC057679]|uniref:alpha/beta hydrolase n=1 Tax=Agromyces sp. NPDC057679 TaxID=3346207 RepID=UPI00366CFF4F
MIADAELAQWLDAVRREPETEPLLEELRAERSRARGPEVDVVEDSFVEAEVRIPVRWYRHAGRTRPTVVFVHGGGFVFGDLDSHDRACRRLATLGDVDVVAVAYRLAPEHPAPAGVDDVIAVVQAILGELPTTPLGLAGDSAGGLIAYLAAHRLVAHGTTVEGLLLLNPNADLRLSRASIRTKAHGWGLSTTALHWFIEKWIPDERANADVYSPLELPAAGMPATIVVTSEHDPLHDEGAELAERLEVGGSLVAHHDLPGMVHGFINLDTVSPSARQAGDRILMEFGRHLGTSPGRTAAAARIDSEGERRLHSR